MYIIGTAGHIDHGKTSLIRMLTGTDCDRLPEEKQREMTIDIGFAKIEYPKFGTVSIIDVPGHERFIRNMVVGAWGVDLGMLVIAVDDSWMPQTEDHFRVLSLLGIERIVIALNKIDMTDEETIELATEEITERLTGTRFEGADIVRVSARTGEGIETLKEVLLENLRKLSRASDTKKPYLFIDRVFSSKGYGTIVTGTLKNGRFHEDQSVTVLPHKTETRIKKIESHYQELEESSISQRTALNLAAMSAEELKRGDIIVSENFFTETSEIVARIQLLYAKKEIKNNLGIEIIIGTITIKAKLILIGRDSQGDTDFIARIRFDNPWHCYPGEPFILTHPGGYRIIGGGTVLLADYENIQIKKELKTDITLLNDFSMVDIALFNIRTHAAVSEETLTGRFAENEKAMQKIITSLVDSGKVVRNEGMLIDAAFHEKALTGILDSIRGKVGPNLTEIAHDAGIDPALCRILIKEAMQREPVVEKEGRFFSGDAITPESLPDVKKKVLATVKKSDISGLALDQTHDESIKRHAKELVRLGFLISLDGNILYHKDTYESLKQSVMKLFDNADKISIPEVRDATGLSRKYIIPLLNRIESEGLVKRIGDFRMKA
ncbi:MAG TPA: selenocysteine-specific translation elongation factor [Spirochaetota bacterium]|nr:selenocysteine-specific translation elongation factor [Spirochaetota bacterium]